MQRDRDASNDYGYENREMPYKGIEKRIRQATKTQEGKNKKSIDRTRGVLTFSFFLFFFPFSVVSLKRAPGNNNMYRKRGVI